MTRIELDIQPARHRDSLRQDLDDLHESYVDAVNRALTDNDPSGAEEIAATYEAEVLDLVAARDRGPRAA